MVTTTILAAVVGQQSLSGTAEGLRRVLTTYNYSGTADRFLTEGFRRYQYSKIDEKIRQETEIALKEIADGIGVDKGQWSAIRAENGPADYVVWSSAKDSGENWVWHDDGTMSDFVIRDSRFDGVIQREGINDDIVLALKRYLKIPGEKELGVYEDIGNFGHEGHQFYGSFVVGEKPNPDGTGSINPDDPWYRRIRVRCGYGFFYLSVDREMGTQQGGGNQFATVRRFGGIWRPKGKGED